VWGIPGPLQSFWKSNDTLFRRLRTDGLQTGMYPRQSNQIDTGKSACRNSLRKVVRCSTAYESHAEQANTVTAAISQIADVGSHDRAARTHSISSLRLHARPPLSQRNLFADQGNYAPTERVVSDVRQEIEVFVIFVLAAFSCAQPFL